MSSPSFQTKHRSWRRYATFKETTECYPEFSLTTLRWWRFRNIGNFNHCVRKIGGKLYVDLERFSHWLDQGGPTDA